MCSINSFKNSFIMLLFAFAIVSVSRAAIADAAGDKRRQQLATVKTIAVLPMFFGTTTLGELPPSTDQHTINKDATTAPKTEKQRQDFENYKATLKELEVHAAARLIDRMGSRTEFKIIDRREVATKLQENKLTTYDLFENQGRIVGKKFAGPNTAELIRAAKLLNCDAILLAVVDEPRKNSGGYYFDLVSGPGYDSPKVHDKAAFDLVLADGMLVLHQMVEVIHPQLRIGERTFVAADWLDTIDQIVEDYMNELTRYTPKPAR